MPNVGLALTQKANKNVVLGVVHLYSLDISTRDRWQQEGMENGCAIEPLNEYVPPLWLFFHHHLVHFWFDLVPPSLDRSIQVPKQRCLRGDSAFLHLLIRLHPIKESHHYSPSSSWSGARVKFCAVLFRDLHLIWPWLSGEFLIWFDYCFIFM